jgi:hypothetical protein
MTSPLKLALMKDWPKGCQPPKNYPDWHDWAAAQHFHGLRQTQCKVCSLWSFPQELDENGVCRRKHFNGEAK